MIKIGIIMDAIDHINISKDSSFAMLIEAQRRNYKIYYMEINDIYLINNDARARTRIIRVKNDHKSWYEFYEEQDLSLSDLDVILMRKDPPLDNEYIFCTHILEHAERKGTLIVNKPKSLRDCNEKIFSTWFPNFIPETLLTCSKQKIKMFTEKHENVILKPVNRMGGTSVFYVKKNDPNFNVIIETLTDNENKYCIAQKYIKDIVNGDKRILIIDGEPVPYCLARIPKDDDTRGNLSAGGKGETRQLTKMDWDIAKYVGSQLKNKGLIFVGLDIIGDRLIEINVTSPTCIKEIEASCSISITGMLMDKIEKYLHN